MSRDLEAFDLRALIDDQLAELHELEELMRAESAPGDPPRPLASYLSAVRSVPSFIDIRGLLVRDTFGAVGGAAECVLVQSEDNPHLAQLSITVRSDQRRQGLGRALLAGATDVVMAAGRSVVVGVTNDAVPAGAAFAKRFGASAVQKSHANRLGLAEVDRDLVAAWVASGPVRAPGYSVQAVDGPLPQHLIDEVASLLYVMNDAPRGDLSIADRHVQADELREWEVQTAASGGVQWWVFARHDRTGRLVGLTEVTWNPSRPHSVHQGDTGVLADHRGHALGKWLKATMLQRLLRDCAAAVDVRTGNADSNAAMLAINWQLGFRPYLHQTTWQVEVTALEESLKG